MSGREGIIERREKRRGNIRVSSIMYIYGI